VRCASWQDRPVFSRVSPALEKGPIRPERPASLAPLKTPANWEVTREGVGLLGCHPVPFYWLKGRRKQNRCFAKILFESFAAGAREGSRKWTGNAFRHLSQKEKRQARQPAVSCLTLWWRGGGSNSRLRFVRVISCGFVVPGFRSRRNETTNPHEITLIMPAISNIQIHQTHETGNVRSAKSAQSAQSALKKLLRRGNFNPT
jgi:hypothetical protein